MGRLDEFLAWVRAEIGRPYVYGAEGPDEFDCSGLVQYTLAKVGVAAPRLARQQQSWATPVTRPSPGDLVFWGAPATHVGIYVGDGQVINAPRPGLRVRQQAIWGSPTYGRVPGLGAGALYSVTSLAGGVGDSVAGWLGGARAVAVQAVAVVFAATLLGLGVWRLSAPARHRVAREIEGVST